MRFPPKLMPAAPNDLGRWPYCFSLSTGDQNGQDPDDAERPCCAERRISPSHRRRSSGASSRRFPKRAPMATFRKTPNTTPPRSSRASTKAASRGSSPLLALAEIIDVTKLSGSTVKFGATVKIVDEDTEEEKKYQIVGDAEADAGKGRISISSPIARAMIGKSVGDSFEVQRPRRLAQLRNPRRAVHLGSSGGVRPARTAGRCDISVQLRHATDACGLSGLETVVARPLF